ncbi:hypothetical protein V2J09_004093 [Rumex salicifolius]
MLAVGGTTPPPTLISSNSSVSKKPLNTFPFLSIQICKTYLFPVSTLSVRRSSLCLFAQKKHRNGGSPVLDARAGSIEEDVVSDIVVDDADFDNEDEELDDDLDVVVPYEELDEWLQKKPRGFGEGKVYDTSIEDELLEEIEQIRKAQLDNISKLKSLSLERTKQLQKDAEAASTGACVRISHLPKKRNIQRDLNAAFKGISGIVNIMPVVFGNKKTKDPICKGLAFVNFKSMEDAKRFMDIYSIQNIAFGKVDKRIKCEIVDSTNTASPKSLNNPNLGGENKANSVEKSGLSLLEEEDDEEKSWDTDSGDEDDGTEESFKSLIASELDEIKRAEQKIKTSVVLQPSKTGDDLQAAARVNTAQKKKEKNKDISSGLSVLEEEDPEKSWDTDSGDEDDGTEESFKSLIASELDEIKRAEQKIKTSVVLQPSKTGDNPQAAVKVNTAQKKKEKNKVAKIPGAAQRLKLKEKAMLADVYARYGSKVTSASKGS